MTVTPSPSPPPCLCLNTPSPQHKIVLVSSWAALTLCAGNKSLVSHLPCCCVNTACCQDETQAPPCRCCGLCVRFHFSVSFLMGTVTDGRRTAQQFVTMSVVKSVEYGVVRIGGRFPLRLDKNQPACVCKDEWSWRGGTGGCKWTYSYNNDPKKMCPSSNEATLLRLWGAFFCRKPSITNSTVSLTLWFCLSCGTLHRLWWESFQIIPNHESENSSPAGLAFVSLR